MLIFYVIWMGFEICEINSESYKAQPIMIPRLDPEDEGLPILRMARVCDGECEDTSGGEVEHDAADTATVLCFRIMVLHMRIEVVSSCQ